MTRLAGTRSPCVVATWPIVISMHYHRAKGKTDASFGDAYGTYVARTSMFLPRPQARGATEPRWGER